MMVFEAKQHKLLDFNKPSMIFYGKKVEVDFSWSFDL